VKWAKKILTEMNDPINELTEIRRLIKEMYSTYGKSIICVGGRDELKLKVQGRKPYSYRAPRNPNLKNINALKLINSRDYYNFSSSEHIYFVDKIDFYKYFREDSFRITALNEICSKEINI
jgi:hypothetical protein